jgi:hypothetical protein
MVGHGRLLKGYPAIRANFTVYGGGLAAHLALVVVPFQPALKAVKAVPNPIFGDLQIHAPFWNKRRFVLPFKNVRIVFVVLVIEIAIAVVVEFIAVWTWLIPVIVVVVAHGVVSFIKAQIG